MRNGFRRVADFTRCTASCTLRKDRKRAHVAKHSRLVGAIQPLSKPIDRSDREARRSRMPSAQTLRSPNITDNCVSYSDWGNRLRDQIVARKRGFAIPRKGFLKVLVQALSAGGAPLGKRLHGRAEAVMG
jgi:hypothetical protein